MKSIFDPTFQNNDAASRIVYAFERLSQLFRVNLWQETKKNSLSPLQIQILLHLNFQPIERRNVSALAQEFKMARATISDAVKTLTKKGFISKEENPYDARSVILGLTETGLNAAQESAMFANVLRQYIVDLPEGERETLLKVLLDLLYQLQLSG
ncbi:MAG: MarR family winged helix-turn-helix transcriptional regulator, partial [Chloroflexota bacterium]